MNVESVLAKMGRNAQAIHSLVGECSEQEARWKPSTTSWSILEVINHLLDEEREDFRKRIDVVLHRPEKAWFGIDPEGWANERSYNQRGLVPSLREFLAARGNHWNGCGDWEKLTGQQSIGHRLGRYELEISWRRGLRTMYFTCAS